MRVFLDTNVLASAVATRGLCADVLREVLARHELVISEQVLTELRSVLRSKFGVPRKPVDELIEFLHQDSTMAQPERSVRARLRDTADVAILGAAVAGGAGVFVTGDKELQNLRHVEEMQILSPRQFWEKIKLGD